MLRQWLGNAMIEWGRLLARSDGTELAVILSDHSITTRMMDPESDTVAWDDTLYRYGNLFLEGYANPIKPTVESEKNLEDEDKATLVESEQTDSEATDGPHTKIISSNRYAEFMRQDLMESILNPAQQWKKIVYAVIALAVLQFGTLMAALAAAGAF